MKVICKDKVIDLSKFDTVYIGKLLFEHEYAYVVQAKKCYVQSSTPEEIVKTRNKELAEAFMKDLTCKWIEGAASFSVVEWETEMLNA